jgi:hypothetical protein
MILWPLLSCTDASLPPTDSGSTDRDCALALLSGGLDEDCNGTAAETVPIADARRLEILGDHSSQFGGAVACSSEPVGDFPAAVAAGGSEIDDENEDAGWTVVVGPTQTGTIDLEESDLVIRGSAEDSDALGWRVVFPGDVDGNGLGDLLVTSLTAYRPDPLTGAAFLFEAPQPGWLTSDSADVYFRGEQVQAMMGVATRAGDLDGDGRAEILLGHTYMNLFDTPGFLALHRGQDFGSTVVADEADVRIDAVDPFQPTGAVMEVADLDGDDIADLVTGEYNVVDPFSPGRVLLLRGPLLDAPSRSFEEASIVLDGEAPEADTGGALAIGDLNADGRSDLVISAAGMEGQAGPRAGKVYVFFGPLQPDIDSVADADLTIEGEIAHSGLSVGLSILDHDGDGFQDLAVAAPSDYYLGPPRPGLVYVFAGPLSPGTLDPATDAAVVYQDDLMLTILGYSMAGCDLDGDGDDELVVGSPRANFASSPNAGRVQVLDGGPWRTP